MSYNFSPLQKEIAETKNWLESELAQIRTGRISPAVLDDVTVDAYGSDTPLEQVAGIKKEGPRTLRINVYDSSQIDAVETALHKEELGASIAKDDEGVRLNFPEMTEDNRRQARERGKEKLEEARVSLRQEREEIWNDIKEKEDEGEISEDEKFRLKEELEERIDEAKQEFAEMFKAKKEQLEQ